MTILNSSPPRASTRILLVMPDTLLQETLSDILQEEGYDLRQALSLAQALSMLDAEAFGLVLTELVDVRVDDPLHAASELVRKANPTPVGLVTGWNLADDDASKAGFAFCLHMPFELDALLAYVAGAMRVDLTPKQEHQAEAARSYLAVMSEGRVDDALALCTETVRYHLQSTSSQASSETQDKASLRGYLLDALRRFPGARFENVNVYALPGRLAARYTVRWSAGTNRDASASGAVVFRFEGERIAEIGVKYNEARVALANAQPTTPLSKASGDAAG